MKIRKIIIAVIIIIIMLLPMNHSLVNAGETKQYSMSQWFIKYQDQDYPNEVASVGWYQKGDASDPKWNIVFFTCSEEKKNKFFAMISDFDKLDITWTELKHTKVEFNELKEKIILKFKDDDYLKENLKVHGEKGLYLRVNTENYQLYKRILKEYDDVLIISESSINAESTDKPNMALVINIILILINIIIIISFFLYKTKKNKTN